MTKEQLRNYRDVAKEKKHLREVLRELEQILDGLKTPRFEYSPHGNETSRPVENMVMRIEATRELYAEKVAELTELTRTVECAIEHLPPRERDLVRLYYIECMTWEEVAVAMNYSWRQTHRIHSNALKMLEGSRS